MSLLAEVVTTRPDAAKFWLFVHILGGMATVGALTLCLIALVGAWRSGSISLTRLGYRALLWGAVPSFIVMRVAAQIVLNKEGLDGDEVDLTWINIGFTVTDVGLLFLIITTVLTGLAVAKRSGAQSNAWCHVPADALVQFMSANAVPKNFAYRYQHQLGDVRRFPGSPLDCIHNIGRRDIAGRQMADAPPHVVTQLLPTPKQGGGSRCFSARVR